VTEDLGLFRFLSYKNGYKSIRRFYIMDNGEAVWKQTAFFICQT